MTDAPMKYWNDADYNMYTPISDDVKPDPVDPKPKPDPVDPKPKPDPKPVDDKPHAKLLHKNSECAVETDWIIGWNLKTLEDCV